MRTALTTRRGIYVLLTLCCAGAIYFYPFLSSSVSWMRESKFRYENRTAVSLPFRWVSGEGPGLVLEKPEVAIVPPPLVNTTLMVSDDGSSPKPSGEARSRALRIFGITDERGVLDDRTNSFTSVGFICGQVGTSKASDMLAFYCFSSDFRYTFNFIGRKEYIPEASEIAKQVIR